MKYLRLIITLSISFFLLNCSEDQTDTKSETGWKGSSIEFNQQFQKNIEPDSTTILLDSKTKEKFEGLLETNNSSLISKQTYESGKLNGESSLTSINGSRVDANFKNGKLHGKMILRDSKGNIRSVINYNEGNISPATE
tara:strand:+ start:611 stop:1027 length:417 start_codon:yes stop_codon:yes gene_type:complete